MIQFKAEEPRDARMVVGFWWRRILMDDGKVRNQAKAGN
jgi:hypothetical protein